MHFAIFGNLYRKNTDRRAKLMQIELFVCIYSLLGVFSPCTRTNFGSAKMKLNVMQLVHTQQTKISLLSGIA